MLRGQIEQQAGDQRAMHHQPAIALDVCRIRPIVMDAVAVEGQRAVAHQQHRIGGQAARTVPRSGIETGRFGPRRPGSGAGGFAIDQRLRFADEQVPALRARLMLQFDEHQRTARAGLGRDRRDPRGPRDVVTDRQRRVKTHRACRPHPPRQVDRRQQAVAPARRVAVGSEPSGRAVGQTQAPVQRLRRQRIGHVAIERGAKPRDARGVNAVGRIAGTADPIGPPRAQLRAASSPRAITCAWISAAPSKMLRMRASHSTRLISYSSA